MNFKIGDKVRIKTLEEMLKNYNSRDFCDFFGHEFFKKWGNYEFVIINIADGIFNKIFKINVNDE